MRGEIEELTKLLKNQHQDTDTDADIETNKNQVELDLMEIIQSGVATRSKHPINIDP